MPWGAVIRPTIALRVAAASSLVFWLGIVTFVAVELAFDQGTDRAPWWLAPLSNVLVFIVWFAACAATVACLLAIRAEWGRLAFLANPGAVAPVDKTRARIGIGSRVEGKQCNVL